MSSRTGHVLHNDGPSTDDVLIWARTNQRSYMPTPSFPNTTAREMRDRYPAGTRVRLLHTDDRFTGLAPNAEGVVTFIDDLGTVHVRWDDGSRLGLVPGYDAWVTA